MRRSTSALSFLLLLVVAPAHAEIQVTSWSLSTLVDDPTRFDRELSLTPQNPFQAVHEARLGQSFGIAAYDFSWGADAGSFVVHLDQQAEDVANGYVHVYGTGLFNFTTDRDLLAHYDVTYRMVLPHYFIGFPTVRLVDLADEDGNRIGDDHLYINTNTSTVTRTFAFHESAYLQAGRVWELYYATRLDSAGDGTHRLGTGTGDISFQLEPAPVYALGDTNCDGAIDTADVAPFVAALLDRVEYRRDHMACDPRTPDLTGDGTVDGADIAPFIAAVMDSAS